MKMIGQFSVQREFTAETRSTPRKELYQVKLLTLRPLCLCCEPYFCSFGCGFAALGLGGEEILIFWFLFERLDRER